MRTALIDADILAYQAAAAVEQPIDWGDGLWSLHAFEDEAIAQFDGQIKKIEEDLEADRLVLAFSDKENWRKDVLPTYKSNRAGVRKPMLLKFLREYAETKYEVFVRPTLEGDDVLGILATHKSKIPGEKIVVSIDKDFKTIPGKHYNFSKGEHFEITEDEANYWHLYQTLTGDQTDGYSGCPSVGPKGAEKLLAVAPTWETVVGAFEGKGLCEEEALVQARVARILRATDYDFSKKQVILWEPK